MGCRDRSLYWSRPDRRGSPATRHIVSKGHPSRETTSNKTAKYQLYLNYKEAGGSGGPVIVSRPCESRATWGKPGKLASSKRIREREHPLRPGAVTQCGRHIP